MRAAETRMPILVASDDIIPALGRRGCCCFADKASVEAANKDGTAVTEAHPKRTPVMLAPADSDSELKRHPLDAPALRYDCFVQWAFESRNLFYCGRPRP